MLQQYRGKSQPNRTNQLQKHSSQNAQQMSPFNMFQHFDQMSNNMMQHMDSQLANLGFGSLMRGFDDFDSEFNGFSRMHDHMANLNMGDVQQNARNGAFQVYSSSYVQTAKQGPNGQMINEKYFDNNAVARGLNGHTISERQQGYKNNNGIDKFAHERMMNDKGRKFIKERDRNGQISTTNHYQNINDDQVEQFENEWLRIGRGLGLQAPPIRDLNQQPFPRQQAALGTPLPARKNDIQPVMLGGYRPNLQNSVTMPPQPPANRAALQQPGIQARGPVNQENRRQPYMPRRNEDQTGVYNNKAMGRNQHPLAG